MYKFMSHASLILTVFLINTELHASSRPNPCKDPDGFAKWLEKTIDNANRSGISVTNSYSQPSYVCIRNNSAVSQSISAGRIVARVSGQINASNSSGGGTIQIGNVGPASKANGKVTVYADGGVSVQGSGLSVSSINGVTAVNGVEVKPGTTVEFKDGKVLVPQPLTDEQLKSIREAAEMPPQSSPNDNQGATAPSEAAILLPVGEPVSGTMEDIANWPVEAPKDDPSKPVGGQGYAEYDKYLAAELGKKYEGHNFQELLDNYDKISKQPQNESALNPFFGAEGAYEELKKSGWLSMNSICINSPDSAIKEKCGKLIKKFASKTLEVMNPS